MPAVCTLNYKITFFFDDSLPLLDEDDMASDSDTSVATQQSIKAYHEANKTVAGDLLHNSLDGLNAGDVYEHISAAQLAALHAAAHNLNSHTQGDNKIFMTKGSEFKEIGLGAAGTYLKSAGDGADLTFSNINHNDLANLNAGDVYEHISAAQLAALHAAVVAGDLNHNDLANIDAGDINHLTDAQVSALHAEQPWQTDSLHMLCLDITYINNESVQLDAVGEYFNVSKYIDSTFDASEDLTFTFVFACNSADASVSFQVYTRAKKTDNSENQSYNIDNPANVGLDSTIANNVSKYSHTIVAANYDVGDVVSCRMRLNEAARILKFWSAEIKYKLA